MDHVLEIKNLSKSYGEKTIVDQGNFSIEPGEIVGLIGKNGVGKTTLMKMILGLTRPDEGMIKFNDQDEIMQDIGYLLDCKLYEYMSGYDNLYVYEKYAGRVSSKNLLKKKIEEMLTFVDLPLNRKKVKSYSFGMKQRLGLALALMGNPQLFILDEPFVGLDPIGVKKFRDFIKKISQEKDVAILISSHQLSEIEQMCRRYFYLSNGKLAEVTQEQQVGLIYLTVNFLTDELKSSLAPLAKMTANHIIIEKQMTIFNKILKLLVENDIEITDIQEKTTIEELFEE